MKWTLIFHKDVCIVKSEIRILIAGLFNLVLLKLSMFIFEKIIIVY